MSLSRRPLRDPGNADYSDGSGRALLRQLLDSENPFSVAHDPASRAQFANANDRINRAWVLAVAASPSAILAPLLTALICRVANLPAAVSSPMEHLAIILPLLVIAFGLAIGIPALWSRRALHRRAACSD